ncbi:hypothetical protein [Rhodococcus rhodochrous]|uniref:hypothetical protein n=1 Tax=Rhodococcus rhodochrous TaxID=1829 RepID=UPI001E58B805|nr:hypothetical protein [Rhodococcus rhodochrous]MCD2096554.1 hypothetical protein [Rhodococcus rhodochrous]MCD2121228.1 hypothetical protein [Rhodococcus rhodochrous]MCQ4137322.1 hypothetical protein [Rhodococcus rhodochrous]MDJ0021185.1 hypothetical protein [Rhodococcus rhodochrous]
MTAPRDLADAQARLDATEAALAGLVHENNELRAIIRRIREYAHEQFRMGSEQVKIGRPYAAIPYDNVGCALERIIGDRL